MPLCPLSLRLTLRFLTNHCLPIRILPLILCFRFYIYKKILLFVILLWMFVLCGWWLIVELEILGKGGADRGESVRVEPAAKIEKHQFHQGKVHFFA